MKRLKSPIMLGMLAMFCITGANAADPATLKDSGETAVRLDTSADIAKPDVSSQRLDTRKVNTERPQLKSLEREASKIPGDQFDTVK